MKRILALISVLALAGCGGDDLPSRDEIPIIRKRVAALEGAIASADTARLDSLLSVEILDEKQDSDSLLSFVYGPDGEFSFYRFGGCEIFYTKELAVVDCYVMDSTETEVRPIKLYFTKAQNVWLLKRFKPGGTGPEDSP